MLFLAHQTGTLHILESFVSTRSFSNKAKIENTKNKFSRAVVGAQVQIPMRFSQKLMILNVNRRCTFFLGEKESDFAANLIYERICI